ncbi:MULTISPECIES: hypothetical protein [Halorussus]|uniref:hypothetical protein n=1 Tax=Halorussus TaxID=1070314 RepID=UPI0013B37871|nr:MULTISPECIES: hypothetical protein [Halorussus]NHN58572.1 hypothetical protein [Halorussus sp. JP-T4]
MAGVAGAAAITANTALGASESSTPSPTYDRTVNVVEDLGVDSMGSQPVEDAIAEAAEPGTKLVFPDGEYLFSMNKAIGSWDDYQNAAGGPVGLVGQGDATFTVPEGFCDYFLRVYGNTIEFRDIDVNLEKPNTSAGFKAYSANGVRIENVTYHGRGAHTDSQVPFACMPVVSNSDATGLVRNLVAHEGSQGGTYKNGQGRGGIWVGFETHGTVRIKDVDLREFGNNAIYASRTPGAVQVEGGYFLNNNASSIRISGEGSYVDGATIEIDPDKYTGPTIASDDEWYYTPIRIEQGELGPDYKPAGVEIRNVDIVARSVGTTVKPIAIWETGRTVSIRNTTIKMDDGGYAIHRRPKRAQSGTYQPPDGPRWVRMDNVTIEGAASGGTTVRIEDAPGTEITGCCISGTGQDRDGVHLINSDSSVIADTTVDVTGRAVSLTDTQAETTNVSKDGGCSTSDKSTTTESTTTEPTTTESTTTETTTTETTTTEPTTRTLVLDGQGNSQFSRYEFSVTGSVGKASDLGSVNDADDISGSTVNGFVKGGQDGYRITGDVSAFEMVGDATVLIDGKEVDPASLGSSDSGSSLPNTLVIDGQTGDRTEYEFDVDGQVEKSSLFGSVNDADTISNGTVSGFVVNGVDGYRFSGDVTRLDVNGTASVEFEDNDG